MDAVEIAWLRKLCGRITPPDVEPQRLTVDERALLKAVHKLLDALEAVRLEKAEAVLMEAEWWFNGGADTEVQLQRIAALREGRRALERAVEGAK